MEGATPRLIDEWQDAPTLWDAVRSVVDERQKVGQFILTGSNSVDKSNILHTGTGRIARIRMAPMSLWESDESTGEISLMELFDNPELEIDGKMSCLDIKQLIFASCRGGWPASLSLPTTRSLVLCGISSYRTAPAGFGPLIVIVLTAYIRARRYDIFPTIPHGAEIIFIKIK